MGATWGRLGANLGPQGGPRGGPEGVQNRSWRPPGPKKSFGGHLGPVWGRFGGQRGVENCMFSKSARRYFRVKDVEKKNAETSEMEGGNVEEVTKKRRNRYEETSKKVTKLSESSRLRTSRSKQAARAYYARVHSSINKNRYGASGIFGDLGGQTFEIARNRRASSKKATSDEKRRKNWARGGFEATSKPTWAQL